MTNKEKQEAEQFQVESRETLDKMLEIDDERFNDPLFIFRAAAHFDETSSSNDYAKCLYFGVLAAALQRLAEQRKGELITVE